MDPHPARARRRVLRALIAIAAFAALPIGVGALGTAAALPASVSPPPLHGAPPLLPVHDPTKPTAVVVAGATGAESIDVLVPYQLLGETDAFNLYALAPERRVLPLFPGSPTLQGIDFVPHLSFDDYETQVGVPPAVIVVPWVPDAGSPDNAELLEWLRTHDTGEATLLTICGGSWTAAEAGLLDGRAATTHQNVLPLVRRDFGDTSWLDGRRWVEDGHVVASAGITAAYDATMRVIERHLGRRTAEDIAARVAYPHLQFLDDPAHTVPAASTAVRALRLAYGGERTRLGVLLTDGIAETDLAAVVDLYPRTMGNEVVGVSLEAPVVTTRHGLHLVPRERLDEVTDLDRLLVTNASDLPAANGAEDLVEGEHLRAADGEHVIDAVLRDIARRESRASAALVARGIEYPIEIEALPGARFPAALLLRPLALGVLGFGLLTAFRRSCRSRGALR